MWGVFIQNVFGFTRKKKGNRLTSWFGKVSPPWASLWSNPRLAHPLRGSKAKTDAKCQNRTQQEHKKHSYLIHQGPSKTDWSWSMDSEVEAMNTSLDVPLSPRQLTGLGMNCLLGQKYRHSGPGLACPQEYNQWLPYRHDASLLPMKEDLAFWLNTLIGETVFHHWYWCQTLVWTSATVRFSIQGVTFKNSNVCKTESWKHALSFTKYPPLFWICAAILK